MRHARINQVAGRFLAVVVLACIGSIAVPATGDTNPPSGAVCGGADQACQVTGGDYHVVLPQSPPGASGYPVVVHLHGWSSSGRQVLAAWGERLVEPVTERGYVLVLPNGLAGQSGRRDWAVRDGFQAGRRDEGAFLKRVLDDVAAIAPIDRSRLLLTGFSRGGSKVWDLACEAPGSFTAFAPLAGGFWNPLPESCAGAVRMLHVHGWRDATVPLEGRRLGDSGLVQGDIVAGLKILRDASDCRRRTANARGRDGDLWWRVWSSCAVGSDFRFVLFPGGHHSPKGWADLVLDWFEGRLTWPQPSREVQMR